METAHHHDEAAVAGGSSDAIGLATLSDSDISSLHSWKGGVQRRRLLELRDLVKESAVLVDEQVWMCSQSGSFPFQRLD